MNEAEQLAKLAEMKATADQALARIEKIGGETEASQVALAALRDALANAGNTSVAVQEAMAALETTLTAIGSTAQAVDDKVVDA